MRFTRRIQDYVLVTLITLLIWLYAEGKDVTTYPDGLPMNLPVKLSVTAPGDLVVEPKQTTVKVRFTGASSQITRLKTELARGPVEVQLGADGHLPEPGVAQLDLMTLISQAMGVGVSSIEPRTLDVTVDELVEASLRLRFEPAEVALLGAAKIDPPAAKVKLPARLLTQLGGTLDALTAEVESATPVRTLPPGVEHKITARVKLPPALAENKDVTLDPPNVAVAFTIDKKEDSLILPPVPVWMEGPPSDIADYRVVLDPESRVIRNVKVTGPADVIKQLRDGQRVNATFTLTGDDLAKLVTTAPIRFNLPPGVQVESPVRTVKFTIARRTEVEPAP